MPAVLKRSEQPYSLYAGKSTRQYYLDLWGGMRQERDSFLPHWQSIANVLLPRRLRSWSGDRQGGDRNQKIIDSTARFAHRTLQSGMHAGLTSPARPWFRLSSADPDLAKYGPVKEWLHTVTSVMRDTFARTNLYNTLPVVYGDLAAFGTAAMAVLTDDANLFHCHAFPIGSYTLALDRKGQVNRFMREYQLTVAAVVEEFGGPGGQPAQRGRPIVWDGISNVVKALYDEGKLDQMVDILWAVTPNMDYRRGSPLNRQLAYKSCHFESKSDDRKVLRESGFRTFRILAPRWDVTAPEDVYGMDCPGMMAFGDMNQIQTQQKKKAQAIAKLIDPSLVGPTSLRTQKVSLLPGDITYVDVREGMQGLRSIHEININLEHLLRDMAEGQERIKWAFFQPLFLMIAQSELLVGPVQKTAEEIRERHEEKLLALGPVLERTNAELLDPLVSIVFDDMLYAGLVPDPPEELEQGPLKVEFESVLHQAQKLTGIVALDRLLTTVGQLSTIPGWEKAAAKIDIFEAVNEYGLILGPNPKVIRDSEEAQADIDEAQQMARDAQMAATAKDAMMAGKAASETSLEGDTALRALVGA